jgi:hypothetical protein
MIALFVWEGNRVNDSEQAETNGPRHGTALFTITAIIVFSLFVSAFILSYDALLNLARDNGINERFSFLWPLGLDAFMAAASLAVIWASINQLKAHWFRVLVGLAVLASIAGNVLHANDNVVSRGIAALPPIVAFLSFEVLMTMIRHESTRAGLRSTLDQLRAEVDQTQAEIDQRQADLESIRDRAQAARSRLKTIDEQLVGHKQLVKELEEAGGDPIKARRNHLTDRPRMSYSVAWRRPGIRSD